MKKIKLTQGKYALIDDEDFDRVNQYKWCAHKEHNIWYAIRKYKGKQLLIRMHRFIINAQQNRQVDHIDGNGLNNCKANLRTCTHNQNQRNRYAIRGTSKYKGVHWHNVNKKWIAQITKNNKNTYLGSHVNETNAAKAYDEKAIEFFGKFANLNFKQNNQD